MNIPSISMPSVPFGTMFNAVKDAAVAAVDKIVSFTKKAVKVVVPVLGKIVKGFGFVTFGVLAAVLALAFIAAVVGLGAFAAAFPVLLVLAIVGVVGWNVVLMSIGCVFVVAGIRMLAAALTAK